MQCAQLANSVSDKSGVTGGSFVMDWRALQRSQGIVALNLQGPWPGPETVKDSQSSSSQASVPATTKFGLNRSMGTAASPSFSFSF